MFIIFFISTIHTLNPENFLCGLRQFYDQKTFFLIDQQNENTMPYILTSQSPHFALDIQQSYKSSSSLNNNSYFLVGFLDAYIFVGNVSQIQWISIQEFKVKQNRTVVSNYIYNGYNGYFVDKQEDGGHLLISKENLVRNFSYGKTDAIDKFENMSYIFIVSWGGKGDPLLILKRFIHLIDSSEDQEYCQQKVAFISLQQIKCNLDKNFEHLTFHTPDIYHPPIHYHLGNELINGSLDNQYFIRNYPGLQVFVAQNLNNKVLELRIPIKNMETHQQTIEYPFSGLIITVQKDNRGFIHILIFESDEGIIINYKEDDNLAYITIGMSDSKVFIFSFVTSQFTKFPTIDFIQHVYQDCVFIIHQRNNVCDNNNLQQCSDISLNLFKQFELQSDKSIKFKSNGEYQDTPYVEMFENRTEIQNEFNVLFQSEIDNREMNHGGYIGSFLRITYKHQSINSLIINEQNENLEVQYSINDNIYSHQIQNIIGKTYVLVFTSQNELTDIQCLQLFREFIDHLQKIFIIEQIESNCETQQQKYYDVQPIQYKQIHKLLKQPAELIQTVDQFNQDDFEYSIDEDENKSQDQNTNSEQSGLVNEVSLISNDNNLENQNLIQDKQNQLQQQQEQINNFDNYQIIYQNKTQEFDQNKKIHQNQNSKQIDQKTYLNNKIQDSNKENRQDNEQSLQIQQQEEYQKTFHQRDEQYDKGYLYKNQQYYKGRQDYQDRRNDYYERDDYFDRNSRRSGPSLTGQRVVIPKNPNDQELGKFFREVISKLYIYSDPCDAKSTNYNPNNCEADNYYGSSSIKRTEPRQRDFYRSAYKYDNRYEYRVCITVYSKCYFKGESLQLCGHQRNIPKSQLYLDILSIRADDNYIVEFYMRGRDGRKELYTLKGTQKCLKAPLRVDWLLQ